MTVANSTFSGNAATESGGAISNSATARVGAASSTACFNCRGSITSQGSNVADDGTCFTGRRHHGDQVVERRILLGPLANNGGPTQTHALLTGSPAIDAVPSGCPPPNTDQRGVTRPVGPRCDAGAFEGGAGGASTLQLSSPTYSVHESGGNAIITVTRTGSSTGAVSATLTLTPGTAAAGSDYTGTSFTVTFASGDMADKTVLIPIVNDALDENDETVNLTLGSPTGGATIGSLQRRRC